MWHKWTPGILVILSREVTPWSYDITNPTTVTLQSEVGVIQQLRVPLNSSHAVRFLWIWTVFRLWHCCSNCSFTGFGALGVSVLASGTQVRGFKPGRSRRIFKGGKILSTPSFGREVKPWVPCRRVAACKRTLNVPWKSAFRQNYRSLFPPVSSNFRR
jgi:hypothetical protein